MRRTSLTGSVVLMALSCVAVLGIAMVAFLAVSNPAMRLSNRAYGKLVSKNLAEAGLERALRSFNADDFVSSGLWTLDAAAGSANLTVPITIPTSRYGSSGITTSVKVRVEHFLSFSGRKATVWSPVQLYAANDFVSYHGVWYLCKNPAPPGAGLIYAPSNTTYWTAAPCNWRPDANYHLGNIVMYEGSAYRCILEPINQATPSSPYWTSGNVAAWNSATNYAVNDVAYSGGVPYRCISASVGNAPPNASYWLCAPVIYSEGIATLPEGKLANGSGGTPIKTQLRAMLEPAPLFPNAIGATERANLSSTGIVDSYNQPLTSNWSSSTSYSVGEFASSGSPPTVYRCIAAHTNRAPPNATFWTATPLGYSAVVAGTKSSGNAVAVTSVVISGFVAATSASSAPFDPQASFGVGSTVSLKGASGTVASPYPGSPNVDRARISRSPYVPQFRFLNPTTINLLSLPSGTNTLPRVGDSIASDGRYYYYINGDIDLNDPDTLNINGAVVIDITPNSADLRIQSFGKIVISNIPGSSLEIRFKDNLFIYSKNALGGIQNLTQDPKRCILIGTSSYNGSSYHYLASNNVNLTFFGVIYMPDAYLHIWNSGRTQNIYGALSAKNIFFNHAANVHYDTSLRTAGAIGTFIEKPYMTSEVRELTDATERITLP
jgi:hypothetical protein